MWMSVGTPTKVAMVARSPPEKLWLRRRAFRPAFAIFTSFLVATSFDNGFFSYLTAI